MPKHLVKHAKSGRPRKNNVGIAMRPGYVPDRLLDALIAMLKLKNDAALACVLGVSPPAISRVRNCRLPVGASLLVRMHEASSLRICVLRELMQEEGASAPEAHTLSSAKIPECSSTNHDFIWNAQGG